ncbi:hypothetical protein [Bradyrhizobium sp. Leo121]|uniref:hypothetical protein n=1 Tax=Bradyrhizobium sp. Leo121 TaxID=1571195 RepID=UPI0032E48335
MFGCWAVFDPVPVGDCAWLEPEAGGLALCVWVFVFEGKLVCAWLVELLEVGACVVLAVPELDGWPAAVCPVDDGDCVWAELVEGLVCADPEDEFDDGVEVEEDGVVDVESCWRCVADGLELDVLGEDCARAEVAIATAAVVAKSKRLFI